MEDVHVTSAEKPLSPATLEQGQDRRRQNHRCDQATSGPSGPSCRSRVGSGTSLCLTWRIDSKLRGCDLVAVRVDDVTPSGYAMDRATIRQKKTGRPVRFELTDQARMTIDEYLKLTGRKSGQFLFAGRRDGARGLTTRQYARLVQDWVASIGLDPAKFGTHSLRRTKAVLIYRRTGNLRAVQLLLGHLNIESTVRYLGIEVNDAIEIAEKIDI